MTTEMNSTEAPRLKKSMSRALFISIFEIAVILGCIIAAFTVPPSTPLKTFLWICAGAFIVANVLLFMALPGKSSHQGLEQRREQQMDRKPNYFRMYFAGIIGVLLLLWQLYERHGR
jgi:hypothetical protein